MRGLRSLTVFVCVSLIAFGSAGCGRSAAHRRAQRERILQERVARDQAAIEAACADWSKASQAKDLDKTMSFYADDAIVLSPKMPCSKARTIFARDGRRCSPFLDRV